MSTLQKTPWHLWAVAIVALLWNGFGAMDYVMTQTRNPQYMSSFTAEQLEFFYSLPKWVIATWAIGIWSAVLGSLLLLFRSRHAVSAFWLSLFGMIVTTIHNFVLSDLPMTKVTGKFEQLFMGLLFLIAVALLWYAHTMRKRGFLR